MLDTLRAGRVLRLIRLIRILRALRSIKLLVFYIFKNRKQGTFSAVLYISLLLLIFSSITILNVENTDESNIRTAEDALWWSFETLTALGYGDMYPVTTEGRIVAAILMIAGVGLFGTLAGFLASWFIEDKNN